MCGRLHSKVVGAWLVSAGVAILAAAHLTGQVRELDSEQELALKITEPFTVASVGDLILFEPISVFAEPSLQALLHLIRTADIGVGNMETNIVDRDRFEGPLRNFAASKAVAADVKAMGFDLLNRANNHTLDSGPEGMLGA